MTGFGPELVANGPRLRTVKSGIFDNIRKRLKMELLLWTYLRISGTLCLCFRADWLLRSNFRVTNSLRPVASPRRCARRPPGLLEQCDWKPLQLHVQDLSQRRTVLVSTNIHGGRGGEGRLLLLDNALHIVRKPAVCTVKPMCTKGPDNGCKPSNHAIPHTMLETCLKNEPGQTESYMVLQGMRKLSITSGVGQANPEQSANCTERLLVFDVA